MVDQPAAEITAAAPFGERVQAEEGGLRAEGAKRAEKRDLPAEGYLAESVSEKAVAAKTDHVGGSCEEAGFFTRVTRFIARG